MSTPLTPSDRIEKSTIGVPGTADGHPCPLSRAPVSSVEVRLQCVDGIGFPDADGRVPFRRGEGVVQFQVRG
jgi:hypothetical protein